MVWCFVLLFCFFCFKQKTAYELRISDWSSDVCSSDLLGFVSMLGVRHVGIARRVVGLIFGGLIFGGLIFRLGFRLLRGDERGGTPTASGDALGAGFGQLRLGQRGAILGGGGAASLGQGCQHRLLGDGPEKFDTAFPMVRSEEHTSELQSL